MAGYAYPDNSDAAGMCALQSVRGTGPQASIGQHLYRHPANGPGAYRLCGYGDHCHNKNDPQHTESPCGHRSFLVLHTSLQGKEFCNKIISPYHPQSNGLVEHTHQTLQRMIAKLDMNQRKNWPDHLSSITLAYNAICLMIQATHPIS